MCASPPEGSWRFAVICASASPEPTILTMKGLTLLAAPALCLAVAACGGDSDAGDSGDAAPATATADIRGKITQLVTPGPEVPAGALVEGEIEPDTRYAKAWVRITETTVILRREGSENVPAGIEELQTGRRVEVRFEGVVAELDPVQASGGEIVIIE